MKTEINEKLKKHAEMLLKKKRLTSKDASFLLDYLHRIEMEESKADLSRKYLSLLEGGLY